ncbi:antitoxin MazE family protein [Bauldia sp.]|uniref:antitoxin MazE family protein n=1 Tax=Bauldia sp. TaxID=2575872 RepID=UPI003BAB10D7
MSNNPNPRSSRDRVRRARLRAEGLRPIEVWVPDTRTAAFAAEARRQSLAVASSTFEQVDQAFVDAISEWSEAGLG